MSFYSKIFARDSKFNHEQKTQVETNAAQVKLAEQDDKTKIELAKLELELKKAELESAEKIAKIEAETAKDISKNQINNLRQYAGSREYSNSGNGRGRGSRPWA
ncbi:MAG: hypothetical protein QE263_03810 [Vampirovibrionales bacterium]|nr:hypothetical protein [Vampirovibrionales bacterium]